MLLADCVELFAGAAEQHGGPRGRVEVERVTAPLQAFSCDVVIVVFSIRPNKEVPLHFKQLLNPIYISKALSL